MKKEKLKEHLQANYSSTNWIKILKFIVGDRNLLEVYSNPYIKTQELTDQQSKYLFSKISEIGALNTSDGARLPLFDIEITSSINIEHNKVGVNSLVKRLMINNAYDGIIAVFHYGENQHKHSEWRFSFISKSGASDYFEEVKSRETNPKKYTYIFGTPEYHRTAIERLYNLQQSELTIEDFFDAFNVEPLSDEFFDEYKKFYLSFTNILIEEYLYIFREQKENTQLNKNAEYEEDIRRDASNFVKRLLSRIVFIYFLQKKNWVGATDTNYRDGDMSFISNLFHGKYGVIDQDNFYEKHLTKLFFKALNLSNRPNDEYILPNKEKRCIPFLNGGLFEENHEPKNHRDIKFPSYLFEELFEFFNSYNFTIYENSPDDHTIAVDPEMLGHIFENLLEDNKDRGTFYTPKEIVQHMTQESLIQYLNTTFPKFDKEDLENLVKNHEVDKLKNNLRDIDQAIDKVKICDPAIGSGAFPMGLLQEIFNIKALINYHLGYKTWSPATVKQNIIQNSIYGVDIEAGAVDISRLRFWLSLVVDENLPKPLPNLDYKIVCGNSIVGYRNDIVRNIKLEDKLELYKSKYFLESNTKDKKQIKKQVDKNLALLLEEMEPFTGYKVDFDFKLFFSEVWKKNDGFDIIIGNPPYIKENKCKKAFNGFKEHSPYYQGKMDIWYGFACIGFDLLKADGVLSFIATNNWTTNTGASKLRNKISKNAKILQLIDFVDYKVFKTAGIQTMIMIFQNKKVKKEYTFDYRKLINKTADKNDVLALFRKDKQYKADGKISFFNQPFNCLDNSIFTFSNHENSIILETIYERQNFKLNADEIRQGIVAPQDFLNKKGQEILGDKHTIGQGVFVLNKTEINSLNLSQHEKKLLRPYYTSEQIKKYSTCSDNEFWIIYTNSNFNKATSLSSYPNIQRHLDQFSKIITSSNKPYGLHRSREEYLFLNEKIIVQRKCPESPIFSYANFDTFISQTFNIIKSTRISLKYLTGLLNSRIIEFWLLNKGKMQGLSFQLDQEPLLNIPIFQASSKSSYLIEKLTDIIIYIRKSKKNINNEFTNNKLDLLFESVINAMIYELYFKEHLEGLHLNVMHLVEQYLNYTATFKQADQINYLFSKWNEPDNELWNRITLQQTKSKYISKIEEVLNKRQRAL